MRKLFLSLVLLGGVAGAGGAVQAAPAISAPTLNTPVLDSPAHVQTVQWGPGWRERERWRERRYERWRRHEAWRRHHEWGHRRYGYRY